MKKEIVSNCCQWGVTNAEDGVLGICKMCGEWCALEVIIMKEYNQLINKQVGD